MKLTFIYIKNNLYGRRSGCSACVLRFEARKNQEKQAKKVRGKNFLKKIKKNEKCRSKQLDLNFVSYYNK